jgi:hypothetical protein
MRDKNYISISRSNQWKIQTDETRGFHRILKYLHNSTFLKKYFIFIYKFKYLINQIKKNITHVVQVLDPKHF